MINDEVEQEIKKKLKRLGCENVRVKIVSDEEGMRVWSKSGDKNIGLYLDDVKMIVLRKDACPLAIAHEIGHALDFASGKKFKTIREMEDSANRFSLSQEQFRKRLEKLMYGRFLFWRYER